MKFEATIPAAELPSGETLVVASGPISLEFRCTVERDGDRLRSRGVATGAAFSLDAEVSERDGALHVVGELHVSGTLAGLGQRELALHARRFISSLAGVR